MTTSSEVSSALPAEPTIDVVAFRAFEYSGWQRAADGWVRHFESLSRQVIPRLLNAAGIVSRAAGRRLLDVASGPGHAAALAAERGATALGIDFAPAQVALARARHPGLEFRVADAEALPFGEAAFDALVINFGIEHFAHPERALAEAHRVLRQGGRIGFTAWGNPKAVAAFHIVERAIDACGDPAVAIPVGPPIDRFSDPAECLAALRAAGFVAPEVEGVRPHWRVEAADAIYEAVAAGTVRSGARLRAQPLDKREAVKAAIREAAGAYRRNGVIELPMPAVLASATKP